MMGCSSHAARWLRSRWERAGWARGRALLVGEPVFVWLTRRGTSLAGIDYSVWRPNPGMLAHIAAVTDVRLHVLDGHPGAEWVCERELHRELAATVDGRQRHRPDGLVVIDGREVAVEVELTLKRRARIEQIMTELVARSSPSAPTTASGSTDSRRHGRTSGDGGGTRRRSASRSRLRSGCCSAAASTSCASVTSAAPNGPAPRPSGRPARRSAPRNDA